MHCFSINFMISDKLLPTLLGSIVTSPIVAQFRHCMQCYPVCHKDHFWDHFFSMFSYMTCVVYDISLIIRHELIIH